MCGPYDSSFRVKEVVLYCIQSNQGDYGSSNNPVGEFEVGIPFINSSLEPTERLPANTGRRVNCLSAHVCDPPLPSRLA